MRTSKLLLIGCVLASTCSLCATAGLTADKHVSAAKKNWANDANATQGDMNAGAGGDYKEADLELNHVYRQILQKNKADKVFLEKFIKAEKAWLAFRDAEVEARFPHSPEDYGSVLSMCQSSELTDLTYARVKQLKAWITGVKEGDVCAGSYPVK